MHHRLHERGVQHRLRDGRRLASVARAAHTDAEQVLGAFAVAAEDLGHPHAAGDERCEERVLVHRTGEPVREDRAGVRRAGVGVHAQHVERSRRGGAQHPVERGGVEGRVGEDVGEHRRHVRLDHAGAFGDPGDRRLTYARGERLGMRVRSHDPFGTHERIGLQVGRDAADADLDLLYGELHADHAGGAHEHALGAGAELGGGGRSHPSRILEATGARGDVAHLAVRHDRSERAPADRLPPEHDRRAGKVVAREDRGRGRVHLAHEHRQILRRGFEAHVPARAAKPTGEAGCLVEGGHGDGEGGAQRERGSYRVRSAGAKRPAAG